MKCEHYFRAGYCVVPTCPHWDRKPEPSPSSGLPRLVLTPYQRSAKYRAHRERMNGERVVATLEGR